MHPAIRMMKIFISILSIIFYCQLTAQQSVEYISVNGTQRTYIQYLPINYNSSESLPIVFVLHGLGGSAQQMTASGFNTIADTARFIPIYPQGLLNGIGQSSWNNGTMLGSGAEDIDFHLQMIQHFENQYNINSNRIYVCGLSAGGVMSYRLAMEIPHKFAAMASMAGTMSTEDLDDFSSTVLNMPVMHWHGTNDVVVPYDTNPVTSISFVPETIQFWKQKNACDFNDSTLTYIPDIMNDGIEVKRVQYDCFYQAPVELWVFENGGHTWYNKQDNDVDGAIEFWKFFKQHSSSGSAALNNFTSQTTLLYPNPTRNLLNVKNEVNKEIDYTIYTLTGKVVLKGSTINKSIKVNSLTQGMYMIELRSDEFSTREKIHILE